MKKRMICWVSKDEINMEFCLYVFIFIAVRVVEVLGTELPLKIYKETQRIEAEGGMTIKVSK